MRKIGTSRPSHPTPRASCCHIDVISVLRGRPFHLPALHNCQEETPFITDTFRHRLHLHTVNPGCINICYMHVCGFVCFALETAFSDVFWVIFGKQNPYNLRTLASRVMFIILDTRSPSAWNVKPMLICIFIIWISSNSCVVNNLGVLLQRHEIC